MGLTMDYQNHNGLLIPPTDIIVPKGKVLITIQNVLTGKITQGLTDNMVVTLGKNAIAAGLFDSSRGMITYCALGTSAVAPALSDTNLVAEIARKQVSVPSVSSNVATFTTFFTTSEAVGTLREAGLFGETASTIPGSGTLFCRTAINRVKSSNDTLTLQWSVTIG